MGKEIDWKKVEQMTALELAKLLNDKIWHMTLAMSGGAISLPYDDAYHNDLEDIQRLSNMLLKKLGKTKEE